MTKDFEFNLTCANWLVENCLFTEIEEQIFWLKIKGKSRTRMAIETNYSEAMVDKILKKIRRKIFKNIHKFKG